MARALPGHHGRRAALHAFVTALLCLITGGAMPVKLPGDLKDWVYLELGEHRNTTKFGTPAPLVSQRMWKRYAQAPS